MCGYRRRRGWWVGGAGESAPKEWHGRMQHTTCTCVKVRVALGWSRNALMGARVGAGAEAFRSSCAKTSHVSAWTVMCRKQAWR